MGMWSESGLGSARTLARGNSASNSFEHKNLSSRESDEGAPSCARCTHSQKAPSPANNSLPCRPRIARTRGPGPLSRLADPPLPRWHWSPRQTAEESLGSCLQSPGCLPTTLPEGQGGRGHRRRPPPMPVVRMPGQLNCYDMSPSPMIYLGEEGLVPGLEYPAWSANRF